MVFNASARSLLVQAGGAAVNVVMHDWWAYVLVTACGGVVRYDPSPTVRYRQHASNQIGAVPHVLKRVLRSNSLLSGQLSRWVDAHVACLRRVAVLITPQHQGILDAFEQARHASGLRRLLCLYRSGVYRQTFAGTLVLKMAILFRRL